MELYKLNELEKVNDKQKEEVYHNTMSPVSSSVIFVKAIAKTLEKVNKAEEYLGQVENLDDSAVMTRSLKDAELLVLFSQELDKAAQIIAEFHKGTSILPEGGLEEFIPLYTNLNDRFYYTKLYITMFSLSKNRKYYNLAVRFLEQLLVFFKEMETQIHETIK